MNCGRAMLVAFCSICATSAAAQGPAQDEPIGILLAAGDIATCVSDPTRSGNATADLIAKEIEIATAKDPEFPVRVLALGDLAYDHGDVKSVGCFDATWGRFKDRILPTPGNHDYETKKGAAYFAYFAETLKALNADKTLATYSLAFPPQKTPSDNPPSWQLIALNSNTSTKAASSQLKWLNAELERTKAMPCVLAFSHAFFYSSGRHGHNDGNNKAQNSKIDLTQPLRPEPIMRPIFETLLAKRASIFLAGHDHHFEQLGRANAAGKPSDNGKSAMAPAGVRSFIVGTGGKRLHSDHPKGNDYEQKWAFTEAYDLKSYGVLRIELYPTGYSWRFIPTKDTPGSMKIVKNVQKDTCSRAP